MWGRDWWGQEWKERNKKTFSLDQPRNKGGLDWFGANGNGGKWIESRYIFKVKLAGFADDCLVDIGDQGKGGIMVDFQVSVFSTWVNGGSNYWYGQD